jgi:voltage-gated potassium channel
MSFASVWRSWRINVHDILEVGGEAHPIGRVVNIFLVILIIANGLAFAAETVDSIYARWGPEFEAFNAFSVIVFTVEYLLRLWSSVEIPLLQRLPPWRARLKFATRPMMIIDLLAILPWYVHGSFLSTSAPCACCACSGCSSSSATRRRCKR